MIHTIEQTTGSGPNAGQSQTARLVAQMRALASAVVESIAAAGAQGAPAGIVYAALMAHGCTLEQFNAMIRGLETAGMIRRSGSLLFATGKEITQ